ncbi:MAG: Asp23/Gls24 family envelope stress response protein [Candidatus Ornithomonoglobus sp.]
MEEEIKEAVEAAKEKTEDVIEAAAEKAEEAAQEDNTAANEATVEPQAPAEAEEEETIGNIKISVDVVSTIAGIAASEIEGVSCMYTSFAEGVAKRLGARRNASNGVRVDMGADSVSIDLYIVVEYGVRIPELAWSVQENVKNSVETMTGLPVSKVNIHIEGISFDKAVEPAEGSAEEITE